MRSSRPLVQVPHLQRLVHRRGDRALPVRRHRHRNDITRVACEGAQLAPALQVPHLQRLVIRRGDRAPPVRTSPPPSDTSRVAFEGAQLAPAVQVPHLQRFVLGGGDCALPVRRHRHASDRTRVAFQGAHQSRSGRMKRRLKRSKPGASRAACEIPLNKFARWPVRLRYGSNRPDHLRGKLRRIFFNHV